MLSTKAGLCGISRNEPKALAANDPSHTNNPGYAEPLQAFARRWGGLELEAFTRALQEGDDQDQVFAILALGYEPTAWIREYLLPFLQSDKPKQRWVSALGLGKMGEQKALPALLSLLTGCFPPEEKPAFKGDDLWIYNDWRRKAILVLRYWPQQDVVPVLLDALQADWRLEQSIPEEIELARRTWRWSQEFVMYTLGWLDRFDVLPDMVGALEIVQPKLSRWRVSLALGWLHADAVFPRIRGDRAILRESAMREAVKAVLQERFGLSQQEQERCLSYYRW